MYMKYLITILLFIQTISTSKNDVTKHKGHLKKFGSSGPYLTINETNLLSTKDFFNNYVKTKTPLLMRSQAKQFPAYSRWSDMYLYQQVLNFDEHFQVNVETVKKESRDQNVVRMLFTQFLDQYKSNDVYMVSPVPEFLKGDVLLPQVLQCEQAKKTLEKTIMWFSSGGTKSVTHTDDYENILCVLSGVKKLILVDYYKFKDIINNIIDVADGSYSTMDVDKVDYTKYPGIQTLEYYNVELKDGDCIYIPFRWIHQVDSFDRNVAINFWFNYENIFNESEFPYECANNQFDKTLTLDRIEYESDEREQSYDAFRTFILRQVNAGNRKLDQWKNVIFKELDITESDLKGFKLDEHIREIFDLLDFDGDALITDAELVDLDTNRLELIARVFEDMYSNIYKKLEENSKSDKKDKEPNSEL